MQIIKYICRHGTDRLFTAAAAALLLLSACETPAVDSTDQRNKGEWPLTDFSKRTVELAEIESGGPPKDGIPAIDRPRFVSPVSARTWLHPDEPVIAVKLGGDARAYPLQILMFHEIVNDRLGETPVAVTFCPLCNASMVFERRVAGRVLDFGTTGRLRLSDLVMYDRQTQSWWQQFTGSGIVGHYAGAMLTLLPSQITSFREFQAAFPQGRILSRDTGFERPYGRNPYRGYDRVGQNPFLFEADVDPRLPAMERVISVKVGASNRIHPFTVLDRTPVINDEIEGIPYVIFSRPGMLSPLDAGEIADSRRIPAATAFSRSLESETYEFKFRDGRLYDVQTGSEWNMFGVAIAGRLKGRSLEPLQSGVHFAFAWLAFNPNSEIYLGK